MTATTTATGTPIAIARYLTNRGTDKRRGKARIEQVFYSEQGWLTVSGQGYTVRQPVIEALARRGATAIALGYVPPAWMTRQPGQRVRADFAIRELVAA